MICRCAEGTSHSLLHQEHLQIAAIATNPRMMAPRSVWLGVLGLTSLISAQSIEGLGVSGGDGPRGGIGDILNPVLEPAAFITDAVIPSAPNTTRQLAAGPPPVLVSDSSNSSFCPPPRQVIIDSSRNGARQEVVGFGHAWTDSTVSTFSTLEPAVLDQVMQDLFSQNDGNNMGFMRHTIGSSDLSGTQYSYDDNGPSFNTGEPDLTLANFTLGPHGEAMAGMLKRMGEYKGDVFLFGSPWSYPGWTKHNGLFVAPQISVDGNAVNILNNSFDTRYVPQMVEYFTKYIDKFQAEYGVTINGLTLMNEPLNYQGGYPTMYLDAADEAAIIAGGLGEALKQRNVLAMAYDHNTDQPAYPMRVITGGQGYVKGTAWHCYQGPFPDYSVIESLHQAFPEVVQFMTECSTYLPQAGSLNFGVARNFIVPVQYGASGAAMWVMATNPNYGPHSPYGGCAGCEGSIIVNSSTTYTKTNDYYMIGQFSRFVRRGAVNHRVIAGIEGNLGTDAQFLIMAVQNPDQSWAVVFMNDLNRDERVRLSFTEGGYVWEGTIPKATVVTWQIPADERVRPPAAVTSAAAVSASVAASAVHWSNSSFASPLYATTAGASMSLGNCTFSPSSSSMSATSSATVIPVPNTTHVVTQNVL